MKTNRMLRVNELLRREIGAALFRVIHENAADLSAITVTHVVASNDLKDAQVLVSVRDPERERAVLGLLQQHRAEIQQLIARNLTLKRTPRLRFLPDASLREGDRVLHVLSEIRTPPSGEEAADHAPAEPESPAP